MDENLFHFCFPKLWQIDFLVCSLFYFFSNKKRLSILMDTFLIHAFTLLKALFFFKHSVIRIAVKQRNKKLLKDQVRLWIELLIFIHPNPVFDILVHLFLSYESDRHIQLHFVKQLHCNNRRSLNVQKHLIVYLLCC